MDRILTYLSLILLYLGTVACDSVLNGYVRRGRSVDDASDNPAGSTSFFKTEDIVPGGVPIYDFSIVNGGSPRIIYKYKSVIYSIETNGNNWNRVSCGALNAATNILFNDSSSYVVSKLGYYDLEVAELNGSGCTRITSENYNYSSFLGGSNKFNGSQIFFPSKNPVNFKPRLVLINSDGTNPQVISDFNSTMNQNDFSPLGTHLVFIGDQDSWGENELYATALDGSQNTKLSKASPPFQSDVKKFIISSDSSHVVYIADHEVYDQDEIYSAPLTLGVAPNPIKLNTSIISAGDVKHFQITSDNSRVLYIADQDNDNVFNIYKVDIAGGNNVALHTPVSSTEYIINSPNFLKNNSFVSYSVINTSTNLQKLFVTNLNSLTSQEASTGLSENTVTGINFVPGQNKIIYTTYTGGVRNYYISNFDGSERFLFQTGVSTKFYFTNSGLIVFIKYIDNQSEIVIYNPIDNNYTYPTQSLDIDDIKSVKYNDSDDKIYFITSKNSRLSFYKVNTDGTQLTLISLPLIASVDDSNHLLSSNGAHVLFDDNDILTLGQTSNHEIINKWEEYPSGAYLKGSFLSPDGSYAFIDIQENTPAPVQGGLVNFNTNEFLIISHGTKPTSQWNLKKIEPIFTPDSQKMIYENAEESHQLNELFSYDLNTHQKIRLHDPLTTGDSIEYDSFQMNPSGTHVAFLAKIGNLDASDLWVSDVNSGNATRISPILPLGREIMSFWFNHDGSKIIYISDEEINEVPKTYSLNLDGSGKATLINFFDPDNEFIYSSPSYTHLGAQLVFRARSKNSIAFSPTTLYVADSDGNNKNTLNPVLPNGSDIFDVFIMKDDETIVYISDQTVYGKKELYKIKFDGTGLIAISGAVLMGGVMDAKAVPNKNELVFRAFLESPTRLDLYHVNVATGTITRLNDIFGPYQSVGTYSPSQSGGSVTFIYYDNNGIGHYSTKILP